MAVIVKHTSSSISVEISSDRDDGLNHFIICNPMECWKEIDKVDQDSGHTLCSLAH